MSLSIRELREEINAIETINKIASAMQNVAASKMKRAQQRRQASAAYAQQILALLKRIASAKSVASNPYLRHLNQEPRNLAIVLIGSDRGLCGALNSNLFKLVEDEVARYQAQKIQLSWSAIGFQALDFCQRRKFNLIAKVRQIGDDPLIGPLMPNIRVLLNYYRTGKVDGILVAYTHFVNNLTRTPVIEQLLPFNTDLIKPASSAATPIKLGHVDYLFEPKQNNSLNYLAVKYLEALVYQAVVDNAACEQVSRMLAMRAASDNAKEITAKLSEMYHKARQVSITSELMDVMSSRYLAEN